MKNLIKPTGLLLVFVVAVIGVSLLPRVFPQPVLIFIGLLALCLTVLTMRGSPSYGWLAVFCMGITFGGSYARYVQQGWLLTELPSQVLFIEGMIVGLPVLSGDITRFDFYPSIASQAEHHGLPDKIRLSWFEAPPIKPGEQWRFKVRIKRPHTFASQGAMDYEVWMIRQGVQATGYVKEGLKLTEPKGHSQWLNRARLHLQQWLLAHGSEANRGMMAALVTGDKSGLSQTQWQQLNRTGTTHLMVISGLHIGLMAALGFWLMGGLGRMGLLPLRLCSLPVLAGALGLMLALFYAALAGFSIPVQRALVMTAVALAGPVLGLRPAAFTLWVTALVVVLLIDPLAFTSQGFWYSFLAVAALLFGLGGRHSLPSHINRWLKPQWVVFCVLTPLLLMSGQPVSPLSPFINLLAIPFVGLLVVPLLLLTALLSVCCAGLAEYALYLADQLLTFFQWFLTVVQPYIGTFPVHAEPGWIIRLLTMLGVFLLISPTALRIRCFAPVLLLPWFFPAESLPENGQAEVMVLDIGQGLSVLVRTHQHTFIYDTGDRFTEEITAADRVLLPGLRAAGIKKIDRVMISHGDRDHSGGLGSLEKVYGALDVWSGSEIDQYQGILTQCQAGQHWTWDGVEFQVLAGGHYTKSNDRSCVLKITAGNDSLLLPGDISSKVEKSLLSQPEPLKARVLVAAHHGSKYSSSDEFLQAVQPEVVIVSAGFANRFGHPAKEILDRASRAKAMVYNTSADGSVSFTLGANLLNISGYRTRWPRYWW